jgi:hypothetical protein
MAGLSLYGGNRNPGGLKPNADWNQSLQSMREVVQASTQAPASGAKIR